MSRGGHTPSPIWEATPPHPRTSSLCVSRTLRNPATPVGAWSRANRPFLYTCVPTYVYAYAHDAFTRDCRRRRRWTLRASRHTHTRKRIHVTRHGVQKGRDWQCRGPTCPLPQHGHAPRGSTWPFSSSGWCATVKLALQILRGTQLIRPVPMQQINPALWIHTCAFDGTHMLAFLDSRWCATISFKDNHWRVSRNVKWKKIFLFL